MIGVPIGLLYSNAVEWVVHKYFLHKLGKKKGSFWQFHWREHHKNVRKYGMKDPDYQKPITDWNARGKEAAGILLLCAAHLPLLKVAPFFTGTVFYAGFNYLRKHRRSHRDPEWAMKHMKWHVDHHLGKDQDQNWCVTQPWFDRLVGTREDYPKETLRVATEANAPALSSGVFDVPNAGSAANDAEDSAGPPSVAPPKIAA
jgi:sterol desaturase/sphingolipid hydroxylase (fatty acid hydroxylase superfamily)